MSEHLAMLTAVLSAESAARAAGCYPDSMGPMPEPAEIVRDARALLSLAQQAQSAAVKACNGEMTEERLTIRNASIKTKAAPVAARYAGKVLLDGDPRGPVLYLRFRSGRSNSFRSGLWAVSIS